MSNQGGPHRRRWLRSLQIPFLPLYSVALSAAFDGAWVWYVTPALVFILIPVLDYLVGTNSKNPSEETVEALTGSRFHRLIVEAYIPVQLAVFVLGAWLFATSDSTVARIGITISIGIVGGIAINAAHELGHKRGDRAKWTALLALAQTAYGHFYVEHNRGHHRNVATPEDPASARFGESLWRFLPRTVIGSLRSAIRLERDRLGRNGQRALSPHNMILQGLSITAIVYLVAFGIGGLTVIPFLIGQAAFGILLLEAVNYLEHYGLLRQTLPNGRPVACQPEHSWNSDHVISNVFLYNLQRHSDHHANPTREYQLLRSYENLPSLPSGYASMILVAAVPPLWRKVMDHRVLDHYNGDRSLLNVG